MSIAFTREYWMPTNVATLPSLGGGAAFDIANMNEKVAIVFMASETQFIDGLFFKIESVGAGTNCNIEVRIEQVDTATGEPNGVLISSTAGRESRAVVTVSAAGDYTVFFPVDDDGLPFELSQGTLCAILFRPLGGGTASNIHFSTFSDDNAAWGMPYCIDYDQPGSFLNAHYRDNIAPVVGLVSSGGYPVNHLWPVTSVALDAFSSTSTPDTLGNRLTISAPVRISGVRAWVDADSTGTIKLYGTNGSTVLASVAIHAGVPPSSNAHIVDYYFSSSVDLAVGTYYIAVEATGSTIGLATMTFPSSPRSTLASSPLGGISMVFSSCTQPPTSTASWTPTSNKQAFLAPIFSGSELGGSAGGGETSHVFAA